ncbi:MAG: hypothetical protein ACRC8Y_02255, partial [Chroococcales cyanobacterium]
MPLSSLNPAASRSKNPRNSRWSSSLSGYLFMTPALMILGVFLGLPILYAIFLSFHKVEILGEMSYRFV